MIADYNITKTRPHAIYRDFKRRKKLQFSVEKKKILIFAQNIDYGYSLEPPHSRIPQFCYLKMELKGVYITRTCFPGVTG